jgi:hypothetical protein
LGPFRFFSKIRGDIRSSALPVSVDTAGAGKCKKSWTPLPPVSLIPVVSLTPQGGKFAAGIVDTSSIFPPVSTTLAKLVAKFAAGVVDTGGAP